MKKKIPPSEETKEPISYLDSLNKKIEELQSRKARSKTVDLFSMLFAVGALLCLNMVAFYLEPYYLIISVSFSMLGLYILFLALSADTASTQEKLDEVIEEKELYLMRSEDDKIVAQKEFKMHQKVLQRYYDSNLSNIRFLSVLGVILILSGVAIVAGALLLYFLTASDALLSSIGVVCGLLIDCIGAFFIAMYTENMKAAIALHSKLAASNNLLLANFIVSKIDTPEVREQALLEISRNISGAKD